MSILSDVKALTKEVNALNFEKLTIQEVADMANRIALEQGEDARTEFISRLISEYHASLA